ncbi:MAG: zinc-dependent metalloprotease [Phycisphaeraceae bacterium]|nr:MAG: zinc-dependent metalloprotease [Phycisphaeraceae bacterium]
MHRSRIVSLIAGLSLALPVFAQNEKPEFPPFNDVAKEYKKVAPPPGVSPFWTIWTREKDGQMLAELNNWGDQQRFYIAPTVASGDPEAGVLPIYTRWGMPGDRYVYWRRYDKQLALIEPQLEIRSTGDNESKAAVARSYTDRVLLTVPIVAMGPGGNPVIDLDAFLLGNARFFFGAFVNGARNDLATIKSVKTFANNAEIAVEVPVIGGRMATLHYSMSSFAENPDYTPREADRRVGFFYSVFSDLSKNQADSEAVRYVNRWHIEKADPKLRLSPPKRPIVFYIEHTTPIRYRRWVREGLLAWNKAFEQVGIVDAIQVHQQDASTGAHMDKDPEDVNYNFIRWTNARIGYAIGPCRVVPETGEIRDADIVMDEGFISGWVREWKDMVPEAALAGMDKESLEWIERHPEWDPRVALRRAGFGPATAARGTVARIAMAGAVVPEELGIAPEDVSELSKVSGMQHRFCACAKGKTMSVALARLAHNLGMLGFDDEVGDKAGKGGDEPDGLIDGVPEEYIGPLVRDVIMHEVGHTLGLMHNYRASSIYSLDQINSPEWKASGKQISGSVMDYHPTNLVYGPGEFRGHYGMTDIGTYDKWAIQWGYTFEDPEPIAKRGTEPELAFTADEGAWGPDPRTRTWDLGDDPFMWAQRNVELAAKLRARLIDRAVKDGQSWQRLREGFQMVMWQHFSGVWNATGQIGGVHISRARRGDPGDELPNVPVPAADQRKALKFVLENGLRDASVGLTPELLARMGADEWWEDWGASPDYPAVDTVVAMQTSTLTRLMSPTLFRRVLDNEARVPAGQDAVTVPEVLESIRKEIWSEVANPSNARPTAREPMVSASRRALQREHVSRLIALSTGRTWGGASGRMMATLAREELRAVQEIVSKAPNGDPYTRAHLSESKERIARALEAAYIRAD